MKRTKIKTDGREFNNTIKPLGICKGSQQLKITKTEK